MGLIKKPLPKFLPFFLKKLSIINVVQFSSISTNDTYDLKAFGVIFLHYSLHLQRSPPHVQIRHQTLHQITCINDNPFQHNLSYIFNSDNFRNQQRRGLGPLGFEPSLFFLRFYPQAFGLPHFFSGNIPIHIGESKTSSKSTNART